MDATQLLPQFGGAAFTLLAFVVALSVIVAIHELGHYLVGRWCGIHAEVFSLGFGPILVHRIDRHGTRWQIAALPFGGYVKFLGDANAAGVGTDARGLPEASRRHTMMGAPLWARAATVAAGPVANFLLAIALFAALALGQGRAVDPITVERVVPLPPAFAAGLAPGDEVLAVAGRPVTVATLQTETEGLAPAPSVEYRLRRNGEEITVAGPYPYPPLAGAVSPDSAAWEAGIRRGDVVTAVDGRPVYAFNEVRDTVAASDGRPLAFSLWRDGETVEVTLEPRRTDLPLPEGGFETRWLVGITGAPFLEPRTETPGLLDALQGAVAELWFVLTSSVSGLLHIVTGAISTCNISGPVGIAEVSGAMAAQGTASFLGFLGVLSAAVGLMNLFPIPILDGGHLVFHAWEGLTGRPPSDRALRLLMGLGLSLILLLTVFAIANDLVLCP